MEREELQSLLNTPTQLKKKIESETPSRKYAEWAKQYNPKLHDITDKAKRPDKQIETDNGLMVVPVARIPISLQKKIVHLAAAFLCGRPIKPHAQAVDSKQSDLLKLIQKVWDDNKLDYMSQQICRLLFSETECAELWYTEPVEASYWKGTGIDKAKFRLRMKPIARSLGDSLYPVFNTYGDMIAFGRGYYIKVDGKDVEHYDLYTDEFIYKGTVDNSELAFTTENNVIGKIPIIYYSQANPEWDDVQELIDRYETLTSNHADTNDYFGSPIIKVSGEIKGLSKKGERGKILEMENGADANYMSWDQSPKSVELEYNNLVRNIFDLTDTPNISFETMKGLGTFSGIALKMLFLGAHLKAAWHEENVGQSVQRRINYIKAALGKFDTSKENDLKELIVKPVFEYYMPKNELEMVELLTTATGNKPIMSQKTAIQLNDLVENKAEELKEVKDEAASEGALNNQFN